MKRFLALVLSLSLALSAFAFYAGAATFNSGAYEYEKINSGTEAKIVKYNGLEEEVVIPETLGGLPVTVVADGAFECVNGLQILSISLPKYLSSFSANALFGNVSLQKIELDEENTNFCLKDGVLYNANMGKLILYPAAAEATFFDVPSGVRIIGPAAFYAAENLKRITLPISLATISNAGTNLPGAFEGCTSLTKVDIPTTVRTIGDYAFMNCTALSEVNIPRSNYKDRVIGLGAFLNCPKLEQIRLYDCVTSVAAEAFGYVVEPNYEGIMISEKLESFRIYGLNSADSAGRYATENGFDFYKIRLISDFFASDSSVLGPENVMGAVSAVSMDDTVDESVLARYFSNLDHYAFVNMSFTATSSETLPAEFEDEVMYSVALPSALKNAGRIFMFFINEDGTLEYTSSWSYTSVDAWGEVAERLMFQSSKIGSFVAVSGEINPGMIVPGEERGTEPTLSDLTFYARELAGWKSEEPYYYLNADLTGDGAMMLNDLTTLSKTIAGWSEKLYSFAFWL